MGDYNIDILNNEVHSQTSDFIDMMYSYSLVPLINRPTRITNNSATLVDNIVSNNLHDLHKSTQAVSITDISDHLPIIHINWNFKDCNEELSIIRRSNTKKNREQFKQAMNNINWTELYSMSVTQSAFSYFHNVIKGLHDKRFPKKQINLRHNCRKPWLTTGLKNAIKTKNELYKKSLMIKCCRNQIRYKIYRNKLKHILIKEGKRCYANLLKSNKSNMKNHGLYWRKFSIKGNNYKFKLNSKWDPVKEDEVTTIICNLKNSVPGHDEITVGSLKGVLAAINHPLVYILNLSLSEGLFPDEQKIAKVVPIRGQRPISDRTYFRHICSLDVNFMQLWFFVLNRFLI